MAGGGGVRRVDRPTVETVLELVTVECRRCSCRVAEGTTTYSKDWNHNICNDTEACTLRMPAGWRAEAHTPGGRLRTGGSRAAADRDTFLLWYVCMPRVGR